MKKKYLIAALQLPGVGRIKLDSFIKNRDVRSIIDDLSFEKFFVEFGHLLSKDINTDNIEKSLKQSKTIIDSAESNSIKIITIFDDIYPVRLKSIKEPPLVLYYKGNLDCITSDYAVAIIGTREPTEHGIKVAQKMAQYFAENEFIITSGLAIGCDTCAHIGSLVVNGMTLAILPSGINKISPKVNLELSDKILASNGCLLSEYPPDQRAFRTNYVERNRLQSALSRGVIVIESDIKSGTMHTANFTIAQNRILGAYNHPEKYVMDKKSTGPNYLIHSKDAFSLSDLSSLEKFKKTLINYRFESTSTTKNIRFDI